MDLLRIGGAVEYVLPHPEYFGFSAANADPSWLDWAKKSYAGYHKDRDRQGFYWTWPLIYNDMEPRGETRGDGVPIYYDREDHYSHSWWW